MSKFSMTAAIRKLSDSVFFIGKGPEDRRANYRRVFLEVAGAALKAGGVKVTSQVESVIDSIAERMNLSSFQRAVAADAARRDPKLSARKPGPARVEKEAEPKGDPISGGMKTRAPSKDPITGKSKKEISAEKKAAAKAAKEAARIKAREAKAANREAKAAKKTTKAKKPVAEGVSKRLKAGMKPKANGAGDVDPITGEATA